MLADMEIVENSLVLGPPLLERFPRSFHTRNTQKGVSRQATIGCPVGFLKILMSVHHLIPDLTCSFVFHCYF
ncbi:hypothetical protein WN51_01668 [Melipona quadrifasciata]|uniref:Uncharacterized protein n=1 Tax=Melipona quadrifasciata TaxID=166423 RepID=A0A0M8ZUH4_9HYME|nr:hypothetical protein WN51_01668 [Melipona quadrifasciata]